MDNVVSIVEVMSENQPVVEWLGGQWHPSASEFKALI
jgi:hypothetical protein